MSTYDDWQDKYDRYLVVRLIDNVADVIVYDSKIHLIVIGDDGPIVLTRSKNGPERMKKCGSVYALGDDPNRLFEPGYMAEGEKIWHTGEWFEYRPHW